MKTLFTSLKITVAFCIILFAGYVLVLYGFAYFVKPNHGEAEVITVDGKTVGVVNVGQHFSQQKYFWGRPSAVQYNGGGSGGSNKGTSNAQYLIEVQGRIDTFLKYHPYLQSKEIPSELVTASSSGLDPHLSPEAVAVQIIRVAQARAIPERQVRQMVDQHIESPFVGKPYINVLKLNIALDQIDKNPL